MLRNIESHRTNGKTSFYKGISASTYILSAATPVAYLITGALNGEKNLKKTALYITESIAISLVITFSTKAIVNRERPAIKDPTFTAVTKANNASFPSGHAAAAFSLATSLAIRHPKWYVIVPSFTWASLVGYSRLYLGVHYPSDILAGAIVGSGSAWLSYKLNKWMRHSKTSKLKEAPAL
jgi:membrane-associated phospholipid phosphatase